ncbi:MAG: hypothetical protein ACTMHG_09810, partial [Marinobacter sp.]
DRLESGVLVCPFGERYMLASPFTYDLILPSAGTAPPTVQKFVDWLIGTAQTFRKQMKGNPGPEGA